MDERYTVLELIGEGSFGRVFKGRLKGTNTLVALKLIPKVNKNPSDIASLRNEFNIQKTLDHPNVVKILDAFETTNEIIVVAEYVPGELHKLFDQYKGSRPKGANRSLPEARVREIAIDLISALFYLHQHRILHRDIKPQNILVDISGRVKLCDFGFARNLSLNTHVLTSIKGTPLYMAPELIEEKPYDHAADIWSVGCILYELLVGNPPFSTKNIIQLINKVRYDAIQWPTNVSEICLNFLQGVLDKDCRKRLSWPELLQHPFVADHFERHPPLTSHRGTAPLTIPLSESEELAKEIQRQAKAKLLPGNSGTLLRIAQNFDLERQRKMEQPNRGRGRRSSVPCAPPAVILPQIEARLSRRHSEEPESSPARAATVVATNDQQGPIPVLQIRTETLPAAGVGSNPNCAHGNGCGCPCQASTSVGTRTPKEKFNKEAWIALMDLDHPWEYSKLLDNDVMFQKVMAPFRERVVDVEVLELLCTALISPLSQSDEDLARSERIMKRYKAERMIGMLCSLLRNILQQPDPSKAMIQVAGYMSSIVTRMIHTHSTFADELRDFLADSRNDPKILLAKMLGCDNGTLQSEGLNWSIRMRDAERKKIPPCLAKSHLEMEIGEHLIKKYPRQYELLKKLVDEELAPPTPRSSLF